MYNPQTNHQPTMSYQLDQLIKNIRWLKPPNVGRCHCSQDYGWSPLWCSLPWRRDPGWRGRSELQQTTHIYISYVGTSALSSGAPTGRATNKNNLKQINNNNKSLESPIFSYCFLLFFIFLFFYMFLIFFSYCFFCSYFILFFFMCF